MSHFYKLHHVGTNIKNSQVMISTPYLMILLLCLWGRLLTAYSYNFDGSHKMTNKNTITLSVVLQNIHHSQYIYIIGVVLNI